jgi:hypothetical protein
MTRALPLTLVLSVVLWSACSAPPRTETVVVINRPAAEVLARIDTVRIRVRDVAANLERYASPADPICGVAPAPCLTMPMVLTLVPGPTRPRDQVEVQVTAQRGAQVIIDQVTRFTFADGMRQRLEFKLLEQCLGSITCPEDPLVGTCADDGTCAPLTPTALTSDPPLDGGVPQNG